MESRNKFSERFDWGLCFLIFLFFIISCIAIYSAQLQGQHQVNFVIKQAVWYVAGAFIVAVIMYFDTEQIKKLTWYLYGFGNLLLFLLMISPEGQGQIGQKINGAKSWFTFPKIGSLQPSEFVKIFLILTLAKIIIDHREKINFHTIKTDSILLLKLGLTTALPLAFIMKQPDLGTGLVIIAILAGMIMVSGISWKIIAPLYLGVISLSTLIIYLVITAPEILVKYLNVKLYQFKRIYVWLDPQSYKGDEAYQLDQSIHAIGSGMISGKGFINREVYIPEVHSDFIFSVIGEEYGFIGASVVVSLFFLLIYHLTKIALNTNDSFNTYVCVGIICMITFHVFQNIGMTIQVLPITGIPLPFLSYGGSSLMGNMMAIGIIFSIRYHHKTYMFGEKSAN